MTKKSNKNWVIIPAAGIGTRMRADRPKQYLPINGKTLLAHVIDIFSSMSEIENVIVVLNAKDHWWPTLKLAHPEKVLTAIGGEKRVHSVSLGLTFLADYADANDWVLVHDAARPCITVPAIKSLISALAEHPVGGLLGLPVVDTLKRVDKQDQVMETVPRDGLWRAQTPQMFRYKALKIAIEKALSDNYHVTDEASAIEYFGQKPKMVLGSLENIKVTYADDLAVAKQLLNALSSR